MSKMIIVADTHVHANAMVKWLKLKPEDCKTYCYGDAMPKVTGQVHMVRPLAGPQDWHFDWIVGVIQPSETSLRALAHKWGVDLKQPAPAPASLLRLAPPSPRLA